MQTEEIVNCFLCNLPGQPLYSHLQDHYFGSSGGWDYQRCSQCGLVWMSPRPAPADIGRLYESSYYTHASSDSGMHAPTAVNGSRSFRKNLRRAFLAAVP